MASEKVTFYRTNDEKTEFIEQLPKTVASQVYDSENEQFLDETLTSLTGIVTDLEERLEQVEEVGGEPELGSITRAHTNFYRKVTVIDTPSVISELNLFNKANIDTLGFYNLNGNYTLASSEEWSHGYGSTGPISVKPNTEYITNTSSFVTYWTDNWVLISSEHLQIAPATITIPENCAYLNSGILLEQQDIIFIYEGNSIPGDGEPVEIQKYIDDDLIITPEQVRSELFGLSWNVLGDSISTTDYATKNYSQIIGEKHSMNVNAYGISGTCIATTTTRSNPMCERYVHMTNNADIITVFGGINDYGEQVPIGTINSTNKSTFMGALNVLCEGLIEKYPGKFIGFIAPMQYRDANNPGLMQYINAMKQVCNKYSIPVLDLFNEGGLYPKNDNINDTYFTYSDGLHPNADGQAIIAKRIEPFIKGYGGSTLGSGGTGGAVDLTAHETSVAPHQYGGKFEWRYNPTTNSLDLVVLD